MAKYTSKDLKIEFDNASGTLQDMSQYIFEINDVSVQAAMEDGHTFSDQWAEALFAGLLSMGEITLRGFYDDTSATGPDAIFRDVGNLNTTGGTRTLKLTWGGTKTTSVETIITAYTRQPARGEVTKFSVTLRPTGTVTET